MSKTSKREYVEAVRRRYANGSKAVKRQILDELCQVCGYHRKYAIRVLNAARRPSGRRAGRPPSYSDPLLQIVLAAIWHASNLPCGKRLVVIVKQWLPWYEVLYGALPTAVRKQLLSMSAATIDRRLEHLRSSVTKRGLSSTKPGSLLKHQIPILTNQWEEHRVGFIEADTVAHCGRSMAGTFVFTLDCVDIASGWTAQRAIWGKGEHRVHEMLKDIERALPFRLRGFDCDNGSEFLNHTIHHYFTRRKRPVQYTRSRPYKKNDNAHIEGKNWTHVRQYLGYKRFDKPELVALLNEMFTTEWPILLNCFLPSVKLIQKKRIGSRIIRIHDHPQTPAQRLLDSPDVSASAKRRIRALIRENNPFELQKRMEAKINRILRLASPWS
jgi:hypothetical protein